MSRNKRSINELNQELQKLNNNLYIYNNQTYIDTKTNLHLYCKSCKQDFYNNWTNIYRNPKCPNCSSGFKRKFIDIKNKIKSINPNILIISEYDDMDIIAYNCKLEYKCLIDGYIGEMKTSHLLNGVSCPVCENKIIIHGINDIATTHPDYVKYFLNKEDTFNYSFGSNHKVSIICPNCGYIKHKVVINNFLRGINHCTICADKISLPEKFCRELLLSLNIKFVYQKIFDWSDKKRYDFYLPNYNTIIEVNGMQHYKETDKNKPFYTDYKNDIYKKDIALQNNILNYIIVDCRKSEFEWLVDNFTYSLNKYFDLSDVSWKIIFEKSQKNLLLEACDLYNKNYSITKIAESLNLCTETISTYLKIGNKISKCNYIPRVRNIKNIVKLDLDYNLIRTYTTLYQIYKNGYKNNQVSKCCKDDKNNIYDGFIWMYEENYIRRKDEYGRKINFGTIR